MVLDLAVGAVMWLDVLVHVTYFAELIDGNNVAPRRAVHEAYSRRELPMMVLSTPSVNVLLMALPNHERSMDAVFSTFVHFINCKGYSVKEKVVYVVQLLTELYVFIPRLGQ
jgi:hypothetical protein